MKAFSGFVPNDRRAWHRAELLEMLGGNEALMGQVERAENEYLFLVGMVTENHESDRSVHDDLKAMRDALEVLQTLYNTGGSAKALFEGEAFRLIGGPKLQALRDLFQGVPGEGLVMAARAAIDKHQLKGGKPTDPMRAERMRLVGAVAIIAEQAGITVRRQGREGNPSTFERLLQFVFDRTDIDTDKFKADTAIKYLLESRASSGAG